MIILSLGMSIKNITHLFPMCRRGHPKGLGAEGWKSFYIELSLCESEQKKEQNKDISLKAQIMMLPH